MTNRLLANYAHLAITFASANALANPVVGEYGFSGNPPTMTISFDEKSGTYTLGAGDYVMFGIQYCELEAYTFCFDDHSFVVLVPPIYENGHQIEQQHSYSKNGLDFSIKYAATIESYYSEFQTPTGKCLDVYQIDTLAHGLVSNGFQRTSHFKIIWSEENGVIAYRGDPDGSEFVYRLNICVD